MKGETFHSFFWRSGKKEWTPEQMSLMFIPCVTIWTSSAWSPSIFVSVFLTGLSVGVSRLSAVVIKASCCQLQASCCTAGSGKMQTIAKRAKADDNAWPGSNNRKS